MSIPHVLEYVLPKNATLNPVKILCSIKTDLQLLLALELKFCYSVVHGAYVQRRHHVRI